MATKEKPLKIGETIYCSFVLVNVGCLMIGLIAWPQLPFLVYVISGSYLLLCVLFPVGICLEFAYARFPIPLSVFLCITLTGLLVLASILHIMQR
jgi:hypothetical protein